MKMKLAYLNSLFKKLVHYKVQALFLTFFAVVNINESKKK